MEINLHQYHAVIINSSAGKDSLVSLYEINRMAEEQGYPKSLIVVSHQDLGRMEWPGVRELAEEQAKFFGFKFVVTRRRRANGETETILDYTLRRGKWPSRNQRWCTSDFKRAPGSRVVTGISKKLRGVVDHQMFLYVFGFRSDESPARAKKIQFSTNKRLSTKTRTVHEYLPVHDWSIEKVWDVIRSNNLPYHYAYDLGMPRLSCVFCIFSPFNALVIAGKHNPELLDEYIEVEEKTGHTFRHEFSLKEVRQAVQSGEEVGPIEDWVM